MSTPEVDPRVTKVRVTMSDPLPFPDPDSAEGAMITGAGKFAVDYVRPDFLDAYLADAQTRWGVIEVGEVPDAGPGGFDGPTWIPPHLDHPEAGTWFPANPGHPAAGDPPPAAARAVATPEA